MGHLSLSAESTMFLRENHPCTGIPIGGLNQAQGFIGGWHQTISSSTQVESPVPLSQTIQPGWDRGSQWKYWKATKARGFDRRLFHKSHQELVGVVLRYECLVTKSILVLWESSFKLPVLQFMPDLRTLNISCCFYVSTFRFEMMQPTFRSKCSTTSSFKRWSPKASSTPDFNRGTWLSQSSTVRGWWLATWSSLEKNPEDLKALKIPSSLVGFFKGPNLGFFFGTQLGPKTMHLAWVGMHQLPSGTWWGCV